MVERGPAQGGTEMKGLQTFPERRTMTTGMSAINEGIVELLADSAYLP